MPHDTLLVEIRCAELPPAQVYALAAGFPQQIYTALQQRGFTDEQSAIAADTDGKPLQLATPRRFAAWLAGIRPTAAGSSVRRKGPALAACYDSDNNPTKPLLGFMRSVGIEDSNQLIHIEEKGRQYVAFDEARGGEALANVLPAIVTQVLLAVNAPRLMRWGDNDYKFIRPLRGVLMQHGTHSIGGSVLGVTATADSYGHPTLSPQPVRLPTAADYIKTMSAASVMVDINTRRHSIIAQFEGTSPEPQTLLDEVTAMCEQPTVYSGTLDKRFLQLPAFCIESCMIKHQRAFPVYENGNLTATYRFITDNAPAQPARMIDGFNTVLRARLNDVEFYISEDKKLSLADALGKLKTITYHRQLGSQRERVSRLQSIADIIANAMQLSDTDRSTLQQAVEICKSDLPTLMVGEYPELEGLIAAAYFCSEPHIADLVRCHNRPDWQNSVAYKKHPQITKALLLTVHLEKLVGMFGIGEQPTGSKDPHGLRKSAAITAGILSGDTEKQLSLEVLLDKIRSIYKENLDDITSAHDFIVARKRQDLLEQKIPAAVLNAVIKTPPPNYLITIEHKAKALQTFLDAPQAAALIEAHKRVNNILRKAEQLNSFAPPAINENLLTENAERDLYQELKTTLQRNKAAEEKDDYRSILENTVAMHSTIDTFFTDVLVNTEDENVRNNRLALLQHLKTLFETVGNLSQLSGS